MVPFVWNIKLTQNIPLGKRIHEEANRAFFNVFSWNLRVYIDNFLIFIAQAKQFLGNCQ
jgi:hypothetical protein